MQRTSALDLASEVLSSPDFALTVGFAQLGGAGVTDAMLMASIGDRYAGLLLLQYPDDLLFRKRLPFML